MRLAIDLRLLYAPAAAGRQRVLSHLASALCERQDPACVLLGAIPGRQSFGSRPPHEAVPLDLPLQDTQEARRLLALAAFAHEADWLLSPWHPLPEKRSCRGMLIINDLIPLRHPEWFPDGGLQRYFAETLRASLDHTDAILAISRFTAREIVELYGFPEKRIHVMPLAVDPVFHPSNKADQDAAADWALLESRLGVQGSYVLSVCTLEPRKNLLGVLAAWEKIGREHLGPERLPKLVLAGSPGWKIDPLLKALEASPFREKIIRTGWIPDDLLAVLYRRTEAFLYPSFYEGFGLPVLEAMAAGAPVLASAVTSLPEVGGDAVITCNPHSVESIAAGLCRVLSDEPLRNHLRKAGRERAKAFTPAAMAEAVCGVLRSEMN